MDIHQVLEYLPHRYPFLLVDRVVAFEPGKFIHAYKNVSVNEPFFQGHFPYRPIMPGVLIVESLAQAAGILAFETLGQRPDTHSVFYLVGVDNTRFKRPVYPGDQLHLHIDVLKQMRGVWKFKASAKVDGETVAEAELMCAKREIA